MKVEDFTNNLGADFYAGVPDSLLKPLCDFLMATYGIDARHHIIAANEGNCAALGAGYHLATGRVPVVYMQNSGEGNIINPFASLLNEKVYGIPMIFVIGWRSEPGLKDEPQHMFQGEITLSLLDVMGIPYFILTKETTVEEVSAVMETFRKQLSQGKQVAFVVKKGALAYDVKTKYTNQNTMLREEILQHLIAVTGDDLIVSTTGKASRELFELREANGQGHERDFLTVGSMGHSSSIALEIALQRPKRKVWCVDGDGAALMHMGAMAVIGASKPKNLVHVVINNEAHESVGGLPTAAKNIDFPALARACGYEYAECASDFGKLDEILQKAKDMNGLCMIEAKSAIGARDNLGRPTTSPQENKKAFMQTTLL